MMTRLSQPTEFQPGSKTRRIERRIALARAAVAWERVWPALWPASGIAGLFAAAALLDLFAPLPWALHAPILSGIITALGLVLYLNFRRVRLPRWQDGARRLERDSALKHRPISEAGDTLLSGAGDPWAEELWRAHLRKRLEGISRLRLSLPVSGLAHKDRYALRYVVLLFLMAGVAVAGRSSFDRLLAAFTSAGAGNDATMDAWIEPPAYTGEAPIYLDRNSDRITVPVGSVLNLRVHGAGHAPGLAVDGSSRGFTGTNGEYGSAVKIADDSHVRVRASGRSLGDWSFHARPDNPPTIAFAEPPGKTEHDALKLSYIAGDDYGVTGVRATIRPHGRAGEPLVIELPLAAVSAKSLKETTYRDLTEHPYAGLDVDVTLEANDAIGQTAHSKTMSVHLPARVFTNPLARALIEQRQNIAGGDPVMRDRVMRTLDALTIAPERFYDGQGNIYAGIRAAYWAIKTTRWSSNPKNNAEDYNHIEALLWQMALSLERGGLSVAAEELRRLQGLITQALAQGAPQDVIDALMQRYQEALQRYLQSLAQNAPRSDEPTPPSSKVLSEKDLDDLMRIIQQLAQSGDRARAAEMLALLQNLLENLHMTSSAGQGGDNGPGGSGGAPKDKALSDAIQGLGDLMGKQRGLLDKTFRQQQGLGDQKGAPALSQEQGQLRDQLGKVLQGLNGQKRDVPKDLNEAGRSMEQSQQQLGGGDLPSASDTQKETLDALRKGAGELAKKLQEESARDGQPGDNGDQDPLGRTQGAKGSGFGNGVKLPSMSDLQRARSILEELRKRAAERGRPKQELDYIDRLLKQF